MIDRSIRYLICTLLLVAGCGKKSSQSDGKITIVFWHSFVASTVPALNQLLEKFQQENPSIEIRAQYVPTGDALLQKLITAIQSHTAPDISWIHADFLQNLVEANAIVPIDEFMKGSDSLTAQELNDIYPALRQLASWRGAMYSVPMEATDLALVYNRQAFRDAGLDPDRPPATWKELHDIALKLTVAKGGDSKVQQVGFFVPIFPASGPLGGWMVWQWLPYLWQAGGYEIALDQSRVTFNSPAGVEALTLWKSIYDDLHLRTFTADYDAAFAGKKLVMTMDGPWNLPHYRDLKNLDWAVAPLPAGPEKRATVVGGEYLAVFRQSEHPAEAWRFAKWLLRPDVQALWSMKSGYLPVRRSVLDVPEYKTFLASNPAVRVFVEQLDVGQSTRPVDYHGMEITRNLAEALEQATVGGVDPRKALDDAAAKSDELLHSVAKK